MRKLARICRRLKRRYGLQFCVNKIGRRFYVYVFDSVRSGWFLDGRFDRLSEVENFLIHSEVYQEI